MKLNETRAELLAEYAAFWWMQGVCGPSMQQVVRDGVSFGWVVVHHSLDGREQNETGGDA